MVYYVRVIVIIFLYYFQLLHSTNLFHSFFLFYFINIIYLPIFLKGM